MIHTDLLLTNVALVVILVTATVTDIVGHRIPNWLSLGGAVLGLVLSSVFFGPAGALTACVGWAVGLGLLLPFYMAGGMAAGDVKLMATVGAFVGWKLVLAAAACTLIFGGVLAVLKIALHAQARATLTRYGQMFKVFFTTMQLVYEKPPAGEAAAQRFPYALAIAVGTGVGIWWQTGLVFGFAI